MNHKELEVFLSNKEIPKVKTKPKTFLGIAKQPHYENVLSNLYAFYFDVDEEHKMGDLFLSSLLDLIQKTKIGKEKSLTIYDEPDIKTEYPSVNGGRIDLLIRNDEHAIIIENKVFHCLNNILENYWNTIKVPVKNKIGIVLSLHPINPTGHPHFINITHIELLKKVMSKVGDYLLGVNEKYLVYLKDLYQNIINLSTSNMDKNALEFYFEHQKKINEAATLKNSVHNHVLSEVELACERLDINLNLSGKRTDRLRYFQSSKNSDLMFTIVLDKLLLQEEEKKLYLIIELKHKELENKERFNAIDFSEDEKKANVLKADFFTNTSARWAHFALKEYKPKEEQIANLSQFIIEKLHEDQFVSIFNKLEDFISN
ncbi:PD-(D/E)XK nuclease family protein [Marinifilum caeruleilacunae]|uniref:PD-(D/E)XK nuclease family protein n=1 Tax=Marinifilum caeruleilacunae TaxID=2499076 RepID=A0ABX1WXI3_9BACT|nr:PD-(D/E)XK nuclease family protein [Marinifilum caeruleilacunae]NOU60575.1 hypothetical protein [Marinifilum caeruleilacunae]